MRYSTIADIYEKIEATTKRLEMTDHLVQLIKETPPEIIGKIAYLTQGKLYPDYEGVEIGMAERMAIDSIVEATGVEEREIVKEWKKIGDLGLTAEKRLVGKPAPKEPLTVEKVYDTLDKIAHTSGEGSVEKKVNMLADLLRDATPKEARYLVRTVTGRLRLGIADMTMLDALAIACGGGKKARIELERAYNLSSDLGRVAETVAREGLEEIKKFKITIGRPIRPMLAERLSSAEEILEKLGGRGAAEYKYDGLRIQAHISPKDIILFSRRLENLTSQFPDVCEALRKNIETKEAIIEGECVAIDPNTGEMQPFQVITQRRGRKYEIKRMTEEIPVTVFLFDALYVNGKDLTILPYPDRRRELEEIVKETDHVKISELLVTGDERELERYMDQAVESGCEGVIVKSIGKDSIYRAGARGWTWVKFKREYKSEMADTADLVIVGAFAGRGKRAGTYGALLMAAYDPETDMFKTVCKLGTGFTDENLAKLPKIMEPHRIEHTHSRVDSKIKADVWFVPTVVLEVIGAELTLSPTHTCALNAIRKDSGIAIRFPRFTGNWRMDKAPEDATTVSELIEMYQSQLKKVSA